RCPRRVLLVDGYFVMRLMFLHQQREIHSGGTSAHDCYFHDLPFTPIPDPGTVNAKEMRSLTAPGPASLRCYRLTADTAPHKHRDGLSIQRLAVQSPLCPRLCSPPSRRCSP